MWPQQRERHSENKFLRFLANLAGHVVLPMGEQTECESFANGNIVATLPCLPFVPFAILKAEADRKHRWYGGHLCDLKFQGHLPNLKLA